MRITADEVAPTPWRNGGGRTRELLAWPHVADWKVRVSIADIDRDGPFSAFPGVDRWFGVLSGGGVILRGRALKPKEGIVQFAGEDAPNCVLIDGPTQDFNAMHRRDAGVFRVQPADRVAVPADGGQPRRPALRRRQWRAHHAAIRLRRLPPPASRGGR